MDKIMGAIKAVQHDISNSETGRDLLINIARDQNKRPVVQSISYPLESTPLSDNAEQAKAWADDTRTWRDVYSTRQYDYLAIVVGGETPVWDKDKEKYVSKEKRDGESQTTQTDELDSELTMGMAQAKTESTPQPTAVPVETVAPQPQPQAEGGDDEDDDLPF
jgi:hypothetical protein